jgi:large subunit ribosomal protein L10
VGEGGVQGKQAEPKKGDPALPAPTELKCIVMDGQTIEVAQWKTLEKIPTKQELLTQIARGVKATPTKIAVGIKALPLKLAYGVKALSELNEDQSMTVQAAAEAKAAESS